MRRIDDVLNGRMQLIVHGTQSMIKTWLERTPDLPDDVVVQEGGATEMLTVAKYLAKYS